MNCPFCKDGDTRVLDSRVADDGGAIRRRRVCGNCQKRFTTIEQMQLTVLKRSGATEPFNREKAVAGVRKACKGRPVSDDDLARLGQQVEDALRALAEAAKGTDNLMHATLAAARAGATTGEWAGTLREVFGEFRAPTGVSGAVGVAEAGAELSEVRERVKGT
ncbi:methylmalonyl-CoA mutase family protein, partial [uncultured Aeromicrobium sp.]|uniref:methylmalonyl-CoA mutase family protein n=1 Tax=uncultured Aeromicrobium sp. TaxID=337820 RepID=UPI0025926F37